jgi:hypothetical protein
LRRIAGQPLRQSFNPESYTGYLASGAIIFAPSNRLRNGAWHGGDLISAKAEHERRLPPLLSFFERDAGPASGPGT